MIDRLTVKRVADTDFQLLEAVEDVDLGEGDTVNPAGLDRLAHQHCVEPAATARPSGVGAEFVAPFTQQLADLVGQLGRERPGADPRRVGLGDAKHVRQRARPDAAACGCLRATVLEDVTNG